MAVISRPCSIIYVQQMAVVSSTPSGSWLRLHQGSVTIVCLLSLFVSLQVGMPGEWGLSIEQRKRLTIAVELVANPSVVFMDEPTSGLDARAAAIVMRAVRNTVDTGRTVVCTIHQPSIHIFDA
jgi:ABC-type transporter Mla maintaining outer membrane lipid asymmetry ATPase subunit MlaF